MMIDLQEMEKHAQAVKKFRSLCDMHRIPFGERRNLTDLVTSLRENRHFAMDFWAMAGDMSVRERGTLSDDEMLEALVEGASGITPATLPQTEKGAAAELKAMLAGVDVDAPVLPDPISEPGDTLTSDEEERERIWASDEQRREPWQTTQRRTAPPEVSKTQRTIAEALLRLEETSRQLQDHLAAIEQTTGRANENAEVSEIKEQREEDTVEETKPIIVPPPGLAKGASIEHEVPFEERRPALVEEPAIHATANTEKAHGRSGIASHSPPTEPEVFEPRPVGSLSRRGFALSEDTDDDPSIVVPLAAYAESHHESLTIRAAVVVVLVVMLGTGWLALSRGYGKDLIDRYGAATREKLGLVRQEIHELTAPPSKTATQPTPQASQPERAAPAPNRPPTRNSSATRSRSAPVPRPAATKPQQKLSPAVSAHSPSSASRAPRVETPLDRRDLVRVPASTMEANLVTSRVPVYPETAKAMGIEGPVVVEAMISRSGAVEYARAISGDPHLRVAAEEAVMKWRYKPYLLNGRAVEAATQVRVVFKLPER
ncbi:TonB family protein [Edaphobacter modestus]|uniref:TonB family protein n=2 Tax=Edaphobacter modestus TaxID=388466 RepID=A0A4Q7YXC1_9BACT|nr:TonB family protein [Edaphobacter modestus]